MDKHTRTLLAQSLGSISRSQVSKDSISLKGAGLVEGTRLAFPSNGRALVASGSVLVFLNSGCSGLMREVVAEVGCDMQDARAVACC